MSIEKSRVKLAAYEDMGHKLGELAKGSTIQQHKLQGAHEALTQVASQIAKLVEDVSKDVDDGKVPEEALGPVRIYIAKAQSIAEGAAAKVSTQQLVNMGRSQAFNDAEGAVRKMHEAILNRLQAFLDSIERGEGLGADVIPLEQRRRVPGGDSPPNLKAQRQAEDVGSAEGANEKASPPPQDAPQEAAEPSPKPRRRRARKAAQKAE